MFYIYKIENKINGKIYIGKTTNLVERIGTHFRETTWEREPSKVLYLAFQKHGKENFIASVVEEIEDDWESREQYWIDYFNSMAPFGYNMIPGGSEPPRMGGEDHPMAKLNWDSVHQIKAKLIKKELSRDIANEFDISIDQIHRINYGAAWSEEGEIYPLKSVALHEEVVEEIRYLLLNTTESHSSIAKRFNIGRTTISAINSGQNHRDDSYSYPLRKSLQERQKEEIEKAILLIQNSTIPLNEISRMFGKHDAWASNINTGLRSYNKERNYPLRKTS